MIKDFNPSHPNQTATDSTAPDANTALLNQSAGFLINPLDLPGVAILVSAGRRVAGVWKPAALGAGVGIAVRTVGHALCL